MSKDMYLPLSFLCCHRAHGINKNTLGTSLSYSSLLSVLEIVQTDQVKPNVEITTDS